MTFKGSNSCSLSLLQSLLKQFKEIEKTVEEIKDDLIEEYVKITNGFTNKPRLDKIIDILREEAQFDANQLLDKSISFEQLIIQDGFIAVNFDLWLLLVRYKIPSIFISSKLLPESRYNSHEFVCYTETNISNYAFILTPAMYRRKDEKKPEYKVIINSNEKMNIDLSDLKNSKCIENLNSALRKYITIEEYLDVYFKKDNTTKYKKKKQGLRDIEFVIEEDEVEEGSEKVPQVYPLVEAKEELFEIEPVKKTRKHKKKKLQVNPHGKNKRTKKLNTDLEFNIIE
jgi:hypothetical protein